MEALTGQVAVVTGAGRGIGEAIGSRLAKLGAAVLLIARDAERLAEVRRQIEAAGRRAESFPLDLLHEDAIAALASTIRERHGRCDILVNNAGIGAMGAPLHETPPETWDAVMATNLRAPYLMIRAPWRRS